MLGLCTAPCSPPIFSEDRSRQLRPYPKGTPVGRVSVCEVSFLSLPTTKRRHIVMQVWLSLQASEQRIQLEEVMPIAHSYRAIQMCEPSLSVSSPLRCVYAARRGPVTIRCYTDSHRPSNSSQKSQCCAGTPASTLNPTPAHLVRTISA